MTRNIGAELATRMTLVNDMLADGESVGAINRADVDGLQAVAPTPQPHATPGEGTSQGRCTLTADEREAIVEGLFAIERQLEGPLRGDLGGYARDQRQAAATLRSLLARHY